MILYRTNEIQFVLPGQVRDKSVQILAIANPDVAQSPNTHFSPEFSFVISRENIGIEVLTTEYVDNVLKMLKQQLPEFVMLDRMNTFLDGVMAVTLEYTWMSDGRRLRQWQAYVMCPSSSNMAATRVALTMTGTCLDNLHIRYNSVFQQMIYSLSFYRL